MNEIPTALRAMGDALHRTADLLERVEEITQAAPMTIEEVATALAVDERTVRRHITDGGLSAFKVGHVWRIPRSSLAAFIDPEETP